MLIIINESELKKFPKETGVTNNLETVLASGKAPTVTQPIYWYEKITGVRDATGGEYLVEIKGDKDAFMNEDIYSYTVYTEPLIPKNHIIICLQQHYPGVRELSKIYKLKAREDVRNIKDIEDDITDLKYLIQSITYYIADLHNNILTEEQKSNSMFNIEMTELFNYIFNPVNNLTIDYKKNWKSFSDIFNDEVFLTKIVKEIYYDKFKLN